MLLIHQSSIYILEDYLFTIFQNYLLCLGCFTGYEPSLMHFYGIVLLYYSYQDKL